MRDDGTMDFTKFYNTGVSSVIPSYSFCVHCLNTVCLFTK